MKHSIIAKTGVILYALVIGFFGVNHLLHAGAMGGIVPRYMPGGGKLWVYITGVCLVLAALSFLIDKYAKTAALLVALFEILVILLVHVPHLNAGDASAMTMILKDSAMTAGALMIAGRG